MADVQRLMAHFRPQAWVRDYAVDIDDGRRDFDVTDHLLSRELAFVNRFKEHSYDADYLAELAGVGDHHDGPFEIDVNIDGWLCDLGLKRPLKPEQLDDLRRHFNATVAA